MYINSIHPMCILYICYSALFVHCCILWYYIVVFLFLLTEPLERHHHLCDVCRCGRQESVRRPERLTCMPTSTSWGRTLTWSRCRCAAGRILHFLFPASCFLIAAPSDCDLLPLRLIESMIPGRMISFPQVITHTLRTVNTPILTWTSGPGPQSGWNKIRNQNSSS